MRHAPTPTLALALALSAATAAAVVARAHTPRAPAATSAAPAGPHAPTADAHAPTAGARVGAFDGVARVARRGNSRRRAGRRATRRGRAAVAALPVVTEIDAEGLRKLLDRGADPAKARPLLVNFWATWCDPCREEFPDLVKLDEEFRDRGLDFVTVSADDISDIKSGVPKFLASMGARMPAYLLNAADTEQAIGLVDRAWGGELPATFLFDREGKITYQHKGRVKPAELREALEKALAPK
jgi:thiol-disulfide isomerase/thioredoxin